MAIDERIHFFRLLRGMTQKYLGTAVGFPERSADVRLAQYETGSRKPKADLTAALAQVLEVSPQALDVPDIDSYIGLMHTLFTLEDIYGLTVSEADGEVCLKVNKDKGRCRAFKNALRLERTGGQAIFRGNQQGRIRQLALLLSEVRYHTNLGESSLKGA